MSKLNATCYMFACHFLTYYYVILRQFPTEETAARKWAKYSNNCRWNILHVHVNLRNKLAKRPVFYIVFVCSNEPELWERRHS